MCVLGFYQYRHSVSMQASVTRLELDLSILVTSDQCHKLTMFKPALLPTLFFSWKAPSFFYLFSTKCQGQTWQLASTPYSQLRHILCSRYHLTTSVTCTTSSFCSKPPVPSLTWSFAIGSCVCFCLTVENVNNKI